MIKDLKINDSGLFEAQILSKDGAIPVNGGRLVFAENVNTNSPILAAVVPMDGSVSQIFHFVFLKDEENKVEAYLAKVGLNLYPLKTEGNRCECVTNGKIYVAQTFMRKKTISL